jgi:hypothetical protein
MRDKNPIDNLIKAMNIFPDQKTLAGEIAEILVSSAETEIMTSDEVETSAGDKLHDALLFLWEWKLLIPIRSSKCGEWDSRILSAEPGERFEMPNISRILVKNAIETGDWNSAKAIADLFEIMGEPECEKMPGLVLELSRACVHQSLTGARIGAACVKSGLKDKTGAMIAVLKGAGIISPKLLSISRTSKSKSPLYEFNPAVYYSV